MKKPSLFVKILTLFGFVVMITAFVCYRAGVFDKDANSETEVASEEDLEMIMGSSKSAEVFPDEAMRPEPTDTPPEEKPEIFPSSKSGRVFDAPDGDDSFNLEDLIIPSSKSGPIIDELPEFIEGLELFPSDTDTTKKLIMGGSKSDGIFEPDDIPNQAPNQAPNQNANQEQQRPIMPSSKKMVPIIEKPKKK